MAQCDAAAGTARYMATLSPAAHQRAIDYMQGGHWLLLWGRFVTIVAAAIIVRMGVLPRIAARTDAAHRPKRSAVAIIVAFLAMDALLELPWTIYSASWREHLYHLSSRPFAGWFSEWLLRLVISTIITSLFLLALYTLMRRAPRTWWIWSTGVAVGLVDCQERAVDPYPNANASVF